MSFEKQVMPDGEYLESVCSRLGVPKALLAENPISVYAEYNTDSLKEAVKDIMESRLQNITIYPPPLFVMSPNTKIYLAKDIVRLNRTKVRISFEDNQGC